MMKISGRENYEQLLTKVKTYTQEQRELLYREAERFFMCHPTTEDWLVNVRRVQEVLK